MIATRIVLVGAIAAIWAGGETRLISTAAETEGRKDETKKNAEPPEFVAPEFKVTDKIAGIWTLDGKTILKHDLKVCGKKDISEQLEKDLMPLAEKVGSQFTLIIRSDGKWEFGSLLDGRIDGLEDEIFAKLTGKEVSKEFNYEERRKRFPNDPKRPLAGSWRWSEADGFTHFGINERYPIRSPGRIVVREGTLELKDKESGEVLGFTFVRKYRNDPDPRFRGKDDGKRGIDRKGHRSSDNDSTQRSLRLLRSAV